MKTRTIPVGSLVQSGSGRRVWQIFGLAVGAALALALAPGTGWITRAQWLPSPRFAKPEYHVALPHFWVSTDLMPNYVPGHVVRAVDSGLSPYVPDYAPSPREQIFRLDYLVNLRAVRRRFPNEPLPCAATLRYYTLAHTFTRPETRLLSAIPPPGPVKATLPNPLPAAAQQEYEQVARDGERLDPDNAFFPMMLAMAQFERYADSEALASLARAAEKPRWNDYVAVETAGRRYSHHRILGPKSAWNDWSKYASVLLPHYASLRELGRLIVWQAVEQEKQGNAEAGIALRGRLMRIAARMRDQSTTLIGTLVGQALFDLSATSPGGTAAVKQSKKDTKAKQHTREAYIAFLRARGQTQEAEWFLRQTQVVIPNASASGAFDLLTHLLIPLTLHWIASLMLVMECVAFALIGGGLAVAHYRKRFEVHSPTPLPSPVRWGIVMGVIVATCLLVPTVTATGIQTFYGVVALLFYVALIALAAGRLGAQTTGPLLRSLVLTVVCVVGLFWALTGQIATVTGYSALMTSFGQPQTDTSEYWRTSLVVSSIVFLLPLAKAVALAIASRVKRVPIGYGVTRGFRILTVPTLSLLLFGYVGAALLTYRQEAKASAVLTRIIENESDFYRERQGVRRQITKEAP